MHSWVQCLKEAGVLPELWVHLKALHREALVGMYRAKTWEETLTWKGQVQMVLNLSLSLADELEYDEDKKLELIKIIEGDTPLVIDTSIIQQGEK